MAKKQYLDLAGLTIYDEQIKAHIAAGDAAVSTKLTNGTITVKEAQHATSADSATTAASATTAGSATKATQDGNGKVISSTYETKSDATAKLTEAKGYTDTVAAGKADASHMHLYTEINFNDRDTYITNGANIQTAIEELDGFVYDLQTNKADATHNHDAKYDAKGAASTAESNAKAYADGKIANLLDNSTEAVDSIMELAEAMENNADAIEALEGIAAGKANATHTHAISDVTNLQSTLNGKAAASDLTSHTNNGDIHVTAAKKTNWDTAYTHSQAAHAPTNAQANVIETIKVNGTALTPSSKAVNITVPTNYLVAADIANKADKATTLSGYGITNAYTKTEVDNKLSAKAAQSSLDAVSSVANEAKSAAATNTQSIASNVSAINAHTGRLTTLETLVGEGFEEITTAEIQALFA